MTFDIEKFRDAGLGGGIHPSLFEFIPNNNENLKYLIQRVHISFSTTTDNVMDRIIKMNILENDKFDAFHWLISISGHSQLNATLNSYSKKGELLKAFPIGYKIEAFNATFDWEAYTVLSWNVTGKINFIS